MGRAIRLYACKHYAPGRYPLPSLTEKNFAVIRNVLLVVELPYLILNLKVTNSRNLHPNLMKPLIVLLSVFVVSLGINFLVSGDPYYLLSGKIAMSTMLLFTAMGHFKFTNGMVLMIPEFVPARKMFVYLTGMFEIAAAILFLAPGVCYATAISLIVFFITILPANIHVAIKKVDYQKATMDGSGVGYLWFRVPLQILFIGWIYYFGVMNC
ncbi:MAG: putative rane protein [Daejeonella sp.]|nr:putative rane protein [Daejeonella sp.]